MRLTLALLPFLFSLPASASVDWDSLLRQNGSEKVLFGLWLDRPAAFQREADTAFAPASNSKLYTAALALEALGPEFRFRTRLQWESVTADTAANLVLAGDGDPSWGMSELGETFTTRLDQIAQALSAQGVRVVEGEVRALAADPRWNDRTFPQGWLAKDALECDGALAQAFNLNINCGVFVLSGPRSGGWKEPGLATPVRLNIDYGDRTEITLTREGQGFALSGLWKKGSVPRSFVLPVPDTRPWILRLFKEALARAGIRLVTAPPHQQPGKIQLLEFASPPLSLILKPFLKNSLNILGDSLLKAVGASRSPSSSLRQAGLASLRQYLAQRGLQEGVDLHDGSGLSRTSRVTPRALIGLLLHLRTLPSFPALWDALTIAGVDGTLAKRMKGTAAEGVLRGKTGTLDGVYNLSGYVPGGGEYVPFVMLSSTTKDKLGPTRAAEDRVGARFAQLVHGGSFATRLLIEPFPYVEEHEGQDRR